MNYAMNYHLFISHLQRLTFNFTANVSRRLPWPTILTHALMSFDDIIVFMPGIDKSIPLVTVSPLLSVSLAERERLLNSGYI